METKPDALTCSWSDAPGNIATFRGTNTTSTSTATTTADNLNIICYSDPTDNENSNYTYRFNITQSQIQNINSFYFYEVRCLWFIYVSWVERSPLRVCSVRIKQVCGN
jgi:uncharacterized protein YpmS